MWTMRYTVQAKLARTALQSESRPLAALLDRVLHNLSMEPSIGVYDPQCQLWKANAGRGARIRYDYHQGTHEVHVREIQTMVPQRVTTRAWAGLRMAG